MAIGDKNPDNYNQLGVDLVQIVRERNRQKLRLFAERNSKKFKVKHLRLLSEEDMRWLIECLNPPDLPPR
jgi:hypothetical protein